MLRGLKIHGPVITLSGQIRHVRVSRNSALRTLPGSALVTSFTVESRRVEFWQSERNWPLLDLRDGDRISVAGGAVDDIVLADCLRLTRSRKIWGETAWALVCSGSLLLLAAGWLFARMWSPAGIPVLLVAAWLMFRAERLLRAQRSVRLS